MEESDQSDSSEHHLEQQAHCMERDQHPSYINNAKLEQALVDQHQSEQDIRESSATLRAILPPIRRNTDAYDDSQILDLSSGACPSPVVVQMDQTNQCIDFPRSCQSTQTETTEVESQRPGLITPVFSPWN